MSKVVKSLPLFNTCAKCCMDMDIRAIDLLIPSLMSPEGQAFVAVHGLDLATLAQLREGVMDLGNGYVKIQHRCQHLQLDNRCGIYEQRPHICRDFVCATKKDCTNGPVSMVRE